MSNEVLFKLCIVLVLIYVGFEAIIHEADLVEFERKVFKYIKAFFKALYYTMKEKRNKNV